MKVAITIFKNGVSPRIDTADSVLVYTIDNGVIKEKEKCRLNFEQPAELISFLQKKDIKKILCGGCPQFFLRMLFVHGLDVVPGLAGDPEHIIKMLISGKLTALPAEDPCKRQRRRKKQAFRGRR